MPDRPNVLFVLTDQHRGDALGADPQSPTRDGTPLVHTPNLDHLLEGGALFSRAYSPAPTSLPARRCLWTGQTPATNGCPRWVSDEWDFEHTLPRTLRDAGYQTWLVGKTHSRPARNHFGFEGIDLHSGIKSVEDAGLDDYANWLDRQGNGEYTEESVGLGRNGWDARPWHLPEHQHPTHWTTTRAIEFLDTKRDPTRPFFLTVSYVRPHQPYDPPQAYWDMYADRDLPSAAVGDWARERYAHHRDDHPSTSAWCADVAPDRVHRARTGYYGAISHVDQQVKRLLRRLDDPGNTLVVMTSDHGDMLGDHTLWRKGYAYEGSARVPLLASFPRSADVDRGRVVDAPVGLEDVMPTMLDVAGVDVPDSVEGRSLRSLLDGGDADWRDHYHGEHGPHFADDNAMQFLVDETTKYVWNPVTGDELLFDLQADPHETTDLSDDPDRQDEVAAWRTRLAARLEGRPEGFTADGELRTRDPSDWD